MIHLNFEYLLKIISVMVIPCNLGIIIISNCKAYLVAMVTVVAVCACTTSIDYTQL